jgi:hypothetical protein
MRLPWGWLTCCCNLGRAWPILALAAAFAASVHAPARAADTIRLQLLWFN